MVVWFFGFFHPFLGKVNHPMYHLKAIFLFVTFLQRNKWPSSHFILQDFSLCECEKVFKRAWVKSIQNSLGQSFQTPSLIVKAFRRTQIHPQVGWIEQFLLLAKRAFRPPRLNLRATRLKPKTICFRMKFSKPQHILSAHSLAFFIVALFPCLQNPANVVSNHVRLHKKKLLSGGR